MCKNTIFDIIGEGEWKSFVVVSYYDELANLSQRDGNRFESTPGVIRSNFKNVKDPTEAVYGFFYATARDHKRVRVCPNDLGFKPQINRDQACYGARTRPDFWEDCD